ncbi:hypothetical protein ACU4GA_17785 [Methylobacterium oryzae CBMB20]
MTETVPPVTDAANRDHARAPRFDPHGRDPRRPSEILCLPPHLPEPSPGRLIILAAGKRPPGGMSAVASRFYRQEARAR